MNVLKKNFEICFELLFDYQTYLSLNLFFFKIIDKYSEKYIKINHQTNKFEFTIFTYTEQIIELNYFDYEYNDKVFLIIRNIVNNKYKDI